MGTPSFISARRWPLALLAAGAVTLLACSGGDRRQSAAGGAAGGEEMGGSGGGGASGGAGGLGGRGGGGPADAGGGGLADGAAGSGGGAGADAATAEAGGSADAAAPDAVAMADGPSGPFTLTSSAFAAGGVIVRKYRCRYDDVSPPLSWTPGPAGTKSYAVTMRSAGSPHWALWDISAETLSLPEKIERLAMPPIPPGSKQCKPNVDGSTWYGYAGACPMGGTNLRPYYFEIYALKVATLPNVTPDTPIRDVNAAIKANQIGMATLIGMAAPQSP
jgi:Raf kinase inhibitor-like YbhB/YbcL family protein